MPESDRKVLFLCTGNSCRSQMAEGWLRHLSDGRIEVASAGIQTHGKNPNTISVMAECGVDISRQESTRVTDEMVADAGLVVTVCGHADEFCPALPPATRKLHWPLSDPARATGSREEVVAVYRASRDEIRDRVSDLLADLDAE